MKKRAWSTSVICIVLMVVLLGIQNFVIESASASSWMIITVDAEYGVGSFTSIAVDSSGHPRISYRDWNHSDLKYAEWTGSRWIVETVDSIGDVGWDSSIALDNNDYPHISYYHYVSSDVGELKYARWTGTDWSIETIDSPSLGKPGWGSSIAIDNAGHAHISYCDAFFDALKYAMWNGGSWVKQTIEYSVGGFTSIALDGGGYPHISYYAIGSYDVMYASWTGTTWETEIVDFQGSLGRFTSLALDSNDRPHISYYDETNLVVKYARWDGSSWVIDIVGPAGDMDSSMALDSSDNPHISYYDNGDLRYAKWNGSGWDIETVDSAGNVGLDSSIALDINGYAHISYEDSTFSHLKYAREGGTTGPPATPSVPSGPTSGLVGQMYSYSTSTVDPDDDQVNYIFDWGDNSTSETGFTSSGTSVSQSHSWSGAGTYGVRAMATDVQGAYSGWSNPLLVTVTVTLPGVPTNLSAVPGNGEVSLFWIPPASDGGSSITNYTIYRGTSQGDEAFLATIGNASTFRDVGLANGQSYYYKVCAVNGVGEGPPSNEANATPATVPSDPLNLQVAAGDGQVTLTWTAPAYDGGSPVTNYTIYRGTTPDGETLLVKMGNAFTFTDTGLANGQTYYYKVSASNRMGEGQKSGEGSATPASGWESILEEMWFWLVIVAVIIVLVAVAVFISRKKKAKKVAGEPPGREEEDAPKQETRE